MKTTVTIRDRDTMEQVRIPIAELVDRLKLKVPMQSGEKLQ
jgi:glycyl-tRNA synthetase (class II)